MTKNEITTLIGKGVYVEGNITVLSSIDIQGVLKGDITAVGNITVGEEGSVLGNIIAKNVDIKGQVDGNLTATESATLDSGATLNGDLFAAKVHFADGSSFNGKCTMIRRKELRVDRKTKKVDLIDLSSEDMLTQS
jgi:cytoskeletal protein CcmA (bactofilin family)